MKNLLEVPAFKQSTSYCGPTALRMVLAYYGKTASEAEIGKRSATTKAHGTTPENLAKAAISYGLKGTWKRNATIKDLRHAFEKKAPVIVDWFSTDEGHYSVVIGVDDKYVTLLDPETGKPRSFDHETFMRIWFDFPSAWIKKASELHIRWMLPLTKA